MLLCYTVNGFVKAKDNMESDESRFITTWSPRGFEGFCLEFEVPITGEGVFEKSVSDELVKEVVSDCGKYGMILVENTYLHR